MYLSFLSYLCTYILGYTYRNSYKRTTVNFRNLLELIWKIKSGSVRYIYIRIYIIKIRYSTNGYKLLLPAYCGQGRNKFFTFDGVEFDYNLTSCWHLLAKDCSGHSRVAILTRTTENNETVNKCTIFGACFPRCMHLSAV